MPGCHYLVSEGGGAGQPTMIFPDSCDSCQDVNRSWRMAGSAAPLHFGPCPGAGGSIQCYGDGWRMLHLIMRALT